MRKNHTKRSTLKENVSDAELSKEGNSLKMIKVTELQSVGKRQTNSRAIFFEKPREHTLYTAERPEPSSICHLRKLLSEL